MQFRADVIMNLRFYPRIRANCLLAYIFNCSISKQYKLQNTHVRSYELVHMFSNVVLRLAPHLLARKMPHYPHSHKIGKNTKHKMGKSIMPIGLLVNHHGKSHMFKNCHHYPRRRRRRHCHNPRHRSNRNIVLSAMHP